MNEKQQIESFIEDFSHYSLNGNIDALKLMLHEETVFVAPDLKTKIKGRKHCLRTIKDYSEQAKTHVYDITNKDIFTWGETANVMLDYYVEYELDNTFYKESGVESWILVYQNEQWLMTWRALIKNRRFS